jgi:putative restriction endonuclease
MRLLRTCILLQARQRLCTNQIVSGYTVFSAKIGANSGGNAPYAFEQPRDRVQHFASRMVRDRVFRRIVLRAYDERCAVTRLKLMNGGGRAEVNAAHIRPVEKNGPDIVNNGIALSGTAHWMFDRGLISLGDDLEILVSRQVNDRDSVLGFLNKTGKAFAPVFAKHRPHSNFRHWHRENCFKN